MKHYFYEYGDLEWLEPADYYRGNWSYVGSVTETKSGELYDLVRNNETFEMRYTTI